MIARIRSYLRPKVDYDNPFRQQIASGLLIFLGVSTILTVFMSIYIINFNIGLSASGGNFILNNTEFMGVISPLAILVWIWGIRNGYYQITATSIVIFTLIPLTTYWQTTLNTIEILIFTLPVIMASILLNRQSSLVAYLVTLILAAGPTIINNEAYDGFIIFFLIYSLITALVIILSSNVQNTAQRSIVELNKTQDIIRATVGTNQEVDEVRAMIATINIVRDQLEYTFARIYLVEDGEIVQRIQAGLNLSQMNIDSDISFSQRSGIYEAINKKEPIKIRTNADDLVRQHLLSGTRGALAIPILDNRNDVIAILDIQSDNTDNFSSAEIQTINLVAQQLGQTIQRLRLITSLRDDLTEQDQLINQQRERLLEYEKAERQTTTEAWRDYLQERGSDFVGYDMEAGATSPIEAINLDDDLEAAIQTGDITVEEDGEQQIVSVPISLRGQSLGAMSFRVPMGSQVVGARQQELIRNVVQRLSLALENKRLFEQSQSQASREQKANEVGNLLLGSTDIDAVLNLAASSFNDALGAIQTQIRLKPSIRNIGENEVNS